MPDRITEEQKLSPAVRRRRLLRRLLIEEEFLKYLRELPLTEAVWIIKTERKAAHRFVEEQFDFMVADTVTGRPTEPPLRPDDDPPIVVEVPERTTGSQVG